MVGAHIALALQGVTPGQLFLRGKKKKSRENTYLLTACQLKASTPWTKAHHIKGCTRASNRLTRPQMPQPESSIMGNCISKTRA